LCLYLKRKAEILDQRKATSFVTPADLMGDILISFGSESLSNKLCPGSGARFDGIICPSFDIAWSHSFVNSMQATHSYDLTGDNVRHSLSRKRASSSGESAISKSNAGRLPASERKQNRKRFLIFYVSGYWIFLQLVIMIAPPLASIRR